MLICQLTDLHVRPLGVAAYRVVETNMLTERALQAVARLAPQPDIVLITGDLTDCGLTSEYELLAGLLARYLPMPVYVIPGNHDQRENFRAALAHLPGVTSDPTFVQYAVETHPIRLVMLDTVVPGFGHGELCPTRLAWLDRTLAEAPDKPTVVAMHHPPFVCGIAHMDRINLLTAPAFGAIIARHPQVHRILCGHHHRSIAARVEQAIATISPSVAHSVELDLRTDAPPAFLMEPAAYQLHRYTPEAGIVTHTAYVESGTGPWPFLLDADYPGAEP